MSVVLVGAEEALETAERMALAILQKATIQVADGVTRRMPVDTGRARGGTQTSLGSPKLDDPERIDKSGSVVTAEAETEASRAKLGDDVFVANAVEYVGYLEDGSSQQAPQGMFQVTVDEVVEQFT